MVCARDASVEKGSAIGTSLIQHSRLECAQAQSSVEYSARVHKATLLESAMSLTNVQLRPPRLCGRANVARSTMGRLLPSVSFHKNSVMFLSNTQCT